MQDTLESYKILDIEPGCSAERVRKAYIALLQTWDPEKHIDNPTLRAEAEKKRREIEEAYKAIKFFLPDLQDAPGQEKPERLKRDFKELATGTSNISAKMVLGGLVALVLVMVFASAYYIYMSGRRVTPGAAGTTEVTTPVE